MKPYAEQTTDELMSALFTEEDRVTREHIEELARRPEAVEPLRGILRDRDRWLGDGRGDWWALLHALTALAAARAEAALPEMLDAILLSYEAEHDWIQERLAAALAHLGEAAVEPLIEYVRRHRDGYREDGDYSFARGAAATALTRIALEHPAARARVLDFLCGLLEDPREDDATFLGLIVTYPLALDRERGLAAARAAYGRGDVDETIQGDFDEMVAWHDAHGPGDELSQDLFDFYAPAEIARRQERWAREEREEAVRYVAGIAPAQLKDEERRKLFEELRQQGAFDRLFTPPDEGDDLEADLDEEADEADEGGEWDEEKEPPTLAPSGYQQTAAGNFVRQPEVGRNDSCPCGSGKKYKKCCGR
jgi:hypothetical protein